MTTDKIFRLLDDLKDATAEGRIRWSETADEDQFRAVLKTGMVRLGNKETFNEDSGTWEKGYVATILNQDGKVVEEVELWGGGERTSMATLYELARRSARRGDSVLDDMLAEVEGRAKEKSPS